MHLPHSHLPWLLQMPWERRGDNWESAGHLGDPETPTLGPLPTAQPGAGVRGEAGQDLPLGCRCRCHCWWDIHSPGPPSRSRTRRRPWSSGHDLGESRDYLGSRAVPFPQPCLWLFGGAQGLQTDSTPSSLHVCECRVPAAHHCSLSPRASASTPLTPCQCPQVRHIPQLGGSGGALTVAEEARGARALQDVELAEGAVEARGLLLGVALALPAQALAPARARLRVPGPDTRLVVGG